MRSSLPAALLIAAAMLSLDGCVSYSLPGIPQEAGAADPQLQMLAKQAIRHQDQHAQLALGIRYEYGQGVPVNWKLAAQLYQQAATHVPGGLFMGMTNGIPMNVTAPLKGLPEAKARLQGLRAKMRAAGYRCTDPGWGGILCGALGGRN